MRADFDKLNKLTLPATILIASVILGGFFYASQINKQRSIERQQEIKLQEDRRQQEIELQTKTEKEKRDYIAKRKMECLDIYKIESDKWNNVKGWVYHEPKDNEGLIISFYNFVRNDKCEIIYKDNKTGENFSKYY